MTIRAATIDDVRAIAALVAAAYAPFIARIGRRPAPMTVDYRHLVSTSDHTYVLLDGGAVVGVLVLVPADDHLLIENVAVDPCHQGKRHGRSLLDFAESVAGLTGSAQVRLYTNAAMTENIAFYRRLGYTEVARRTEDGFRRVFFRKNLIPPAPH